MSESKSGYVAFREFKNGTSASVIEMTYGKGRICHGRTDQWDQEFDRQYWFKSVDAAVAALKKWDGIGEPENWFRNPETGRRRPNGDRKRE